MSSRSQQPAPDPSRHPASENAKNLWNHGPNWISAIAALIGALGLGGAVTHFADSGDPSPDSSGTPTATSTVTVTVEPSGDTAPSEAANDAGAEGVRWSGEVTLGELNFDFSPPKLTPGNTVGQLQSDMVWVDDSAEVLIAAWLSDSEPTKDECDTTVAENGSTVVRDLTKGLYLCGKTAEGRIFRLETLTTGNSIKTDATVWN